MAVAEIYPCFGFEFLGMCNYDPQAPSPSYFTIGDAVAALAFTFAVQQFLKPIYQFRLRAMGIKFSYVVCAVFVGAFCTVIAAAVPSIVFVRGTPLAYPMNWEIFGGLVIGAAYAIVAWISLRTAIVTLRNVGDFTRAGAMLLSEATEEDRSSFAKDVLSSVNIETLAKISAEFERAEGHAIAIEFEKLREQGKEQSILGRPPISPFYAFARRKELERARYAWHLLQLISEPDFCGVVVTRHPWRFLQAITPVAEGNVFAAGVKAFVQSVAWQALMQSEGMLAREDSYQGFGVTRGFAKEFFGNYKMRMFDPLNGISSIGTGVPCDGFVSRLNIASELMVSAELEYRGFWESHSTSSVVRIYERVCHSVSFARSDGQKPEYLWDLERGVTGLSELIVDSLENSEADTYNLLFESESRKHRYDSVERIAKLVSEALICVSIKFEGFEDPAWSFSIDVVDKVFDRFGDMPIGLSPFQQAVAIKLIKKLEENMDGYYPTLSRVLLAVIGPYKTSVPEKPGSAAAILKDAIYFALKRLPELYEKSPEKVAECLPPNVTYEHAARSLIHTCRGGNQVTTMLDELPIEKVDLLEEKYLRKR